MAVNEEKLDRILYFQTTAEEVSYCDMSHREAVRLRVEEVRVNVVACMSERRHSYGAHLEVVKATVHQHISHELAAHFVVVAGIDFQR